MSPLASRTARVYSKNVMNYITLSTAIDTTKAFFQGREEVTLEDVYRAMGRDNKADEVNRSWITNRLTHLKHYGLVEPVYTKGRPSRLIGIRLTEQGKRAIKQVALNEHSAVSDMPNVVGDTTEVDTLIRSVRASIAVLEKKLPAELEVVFDVKLRKASQ
ncbi:MAG TPA: hypothetical protein VFK47_09280 [Ktedonobacteraceae bacterium]|nr:hypothetical protein [Ktedonobacteraceae bacterium]